MSLVDALEIATSTDPGIVRSHNEDSISADPAIGLAVLADGMGGYNAGEVASGMAITVITTEMQHALATLHPERVEPGDSRGFVEDLLREQIAKANASIFQAAQSQPQYAGMGTTLVAAMFYDNAVTFAHIGDSRAYRLRQGIFEQLTRDHSLLQEQIDSGIITPEQARFSHNKNLVTRAVGIDPTVDAELNEYATLPGDIYLMCSDGLNDMVADEDIAQALRALAGDLPGAARQLVQMANDAGGRDNISVILVKVTREFGVPRGLFARVRNWFK